MFFFLRDFFGKFLYFVHAANWTQHFTFLLLDSHGTWDATLKMTKVKLELIPEREFHDISDKGIYTF